MTARYEFRKMMIQVFAMGVLLIMACILSRMLTGDRYTAMIPLEGAPAEVADLHFTEDATHTADFEDPRIHDGILYVDVHAEGSGDCVMEVCDGEGHVLVTENYRVTADRTVFEETTGNFTGDSFLAGTLALFFLGTAVLMLRFFLRSTGKRMYSYNVIFSVGMAAFCGLTGIMLLFLFIRHLTEPRAFPMRNIYSIISNAGSSFAKVTSPAVIIFSVLLIVSNIALLTHERYRFQNILGLLIGVIMIAGTAVLFIVDRKLPPAESGFSIFTVAVHVYGTVFTYFECMLLGSVVCGIRAARHIPAYDKDFIIILGCRFRKDGSLTPLLKGRVDRAVSFRDEQYAETGRKAILIPSGGQGPDETMSEADAMARYLEQRGISGTDIAKETKSKNTFQNMAFSKAVADSISPGAEIAFCTTNYHVLRSGIWAAEAGLEAEGFGCGTKWWFWPNAFIRECIGLLVRKFPEEILLLTAIIVFLGGLTYLLM
ncbi:MAG: YdcF family protein [Lachnospiraceae bacterium]|nr:YdcF family protein [Lachnospiraceae bacterium]